MRIPFEKFFEEHENDFPESAIDLFKESVLCYKVGANRSAFLMALNGFHIIIVDRLINSSVIPQTYKPQEWQEKIKELNNDDKRDEVLKGLIETIHTSLVTGKSFKFPFMSEHDWHIGPCVTKQEYRGQGIYPYVLCSIIQEHASIGGQLYDC